MATTSPVQDLLGGARIKSVNFFSFYLSLIHTSEENLSLKHELSLMEEKLATFEELKLENQRLKSLLEFGEEENLKKVLAQVISWDASGKFRLLRINKGKKDGVVLKATVVSSKGLIGHIYRITDHYADILTILDPNNRVDSLVQRTRSHGIVEGGAKQLLSMKYVTRTEEVKVNDLIITSGLSNIYPKGIIIGHIERLERENYGITQYIEVRPNVDFQRLEEVIVLRLENNEEKQREFLDLDESQKAL